MRLFIAVNLPGKERQRIYRASSRLRDQGLPVGWIDPENYHLTLKFLGQVRADRIPAIEAALRKVAADNGPFPISLGGFGAFPTVRRPRVLWLGVDATPELRCLKQDVEWALSDLGFVTETRAFHPHITLGRADERNGAGAFRGLDDIAAAMEFSGEVPVRSIDLMRSHLSKEGTRYSVVTGVQLGSGG